MVLNYIYLGKIYPMIKLNDETRKSYRNALLKYCKLDTLAMVKVLEKLKESVR